MFFQDNNQFSKEKFFNAVSDENQLEIERQLNLPGANVNVTTQVFLGHETALHVLTIDGNANIELLNFLLDRGLDWNILNEDGETGMHFTAIYDDVDAANVLLERGASFEVRCYKNRTPLHLAARHYSPDMLAFLLQNGADIHATDNDGNTPLHLLVLELEDIYLYNDNDDIDEALADVRLLLDNGANITIVNNDGNTAFDLLTKPSELKQLLEETLIEQCTDNITGIHL